MSTARTRIPSLDGLRAVSIALVLVSHLAGTPRTWGWLSTLHADIDLGTFGVRIFFVISGFLITGLLLTEQERTGTIDVRRFYFRRVFRIFPPYYAFLLLLAIAAALGWVTLEPEHLTRAAIYISNYGGNPSILDHTWSLSVEEQFYLLWPAILLLTGVRRGLHIAFLFVLIAPLVRGGLHLLPEQSMGWLVRSNSRSFETVADAIAVGCLLAGTRERLWRWPAYRSLLQSRWFVCVPVLAFAAAATGSETTRSLGNQFLVNAFYQLIGITFINVAIALVIERCVRYPDGAIGWVLNSAPVAFVGTLSYSIYLWQQPFLPVGFPTSLILTAVAALVSYYLIERPSLRLRSRLERRWLARQGTKLESARGDRQPSISPGI